MKSGWKIKQEQMQTVSATFWSKVLYFLFNYQTQNFIAAQLLESRALPQGGTEFEEWSDRIISGSMLPADKVSLKYALANMIPHLGPTESHKPDAYFIHQLKKAACNQVAVAKIAEYTEIYKKRKEDEKAAKEAEEQKTQSGAQ